MKKLFIFAFAIFAMSLGIREIKADNNDIASWQGSGALNNIDVVKIDENGDLRLYNTDIVLGNQGIQPSDSTGGYYGIKVPCYAVTAISQWDLVIASNTGTGYCRTGTATADLTSFLGISDGNYAAGSVAYVTVAGFTLAKTTGTVNIGDALVTGTTSAGSLIADTTPTTGAKVGIALKAGTASGGNTLILLK